MSNKSLAIIIIFINTSTNLRLIETVMISLGEKKIKVQDWFEELGQNIIDSFLSVEKNHSSQNPKIKNNSWNRDGGGGGKSSIIYGKVFEKVGINISTVFGKFSDTFSKEIPGALESNGNFWASGISVVSHMQSPFIPAIHMNTRFICTSKSWFGGGIDLTPIYQNENDNSFFHNTLKKACDKFDSKYYEKFKNQCDEYFFLPHRKEFRGIGGIFYDNLNTEDWLKDFNYTKEIGKSFIEIYSTIINRNINKSWTEDEREFQLIKRGRYVEFNLLYDRGTKFGIMTDGNVEAILMSLPPLVKWI